MTLSQKLEAIKCEIESHGPFDTAEATSIRQHIRELLAAIKNAKLPREIKMCAHCQAKPARTKYIDEESRAAHERRGYSLHEYSLYERKSKFCSDECRAEHYRGRPQYQEARKRDATIKELRDQGLTYAAIGRAVGRSKDRVRQVLLKFERR